MKISASDLALLREAIEPLDTPELRDIYIEGEFPRAELVKDLDMRYRWDLLYGADFLYPPQALTGRMSEHLYAQGLNDEHIDTALRAIVSPLVAAS